MKVIINYQEYADVEVEKSVLRELPGVEIVESRTRDVGEFIREARDADAAIIQYVPCPREAIEAMDRARVIVRYGIAVDTIDLAAAAARGIRVCHVPSYCLDEVSNHAITLILALVRKLHHILPNSRKAVWDYKYTKPIYNFRNKTLGILGLGRVGRSLVPKAKGFGMNVSAYDPYVEDDIFALLGVTRRYELEDLLTEADFISIHTPLTPETYHLIDADALSKMKKTAIIVNSARGPIIDEGALCDALDSGTIAAAGIDVLETEPPAADNPLLAKENALVTPHVAWYSEESFEADMIDGMDELQRVLTGKRPRFIVNPEIFGRRKRRGGE